MSELTDAEKRFVEFYNKVNEHLQQISLVRHGELIDAAETCAQAIFWTQVLDSHFPELLPVVEALSQLVSMRGNRVSTPEESEKTKKRYLN